MILGNKSFEPDFRIRTQNPGSNYLSPRLIESGSNYWIRLELINQARRFLNHTRILKSGSKLLNQGMAREPRMAWPKDGLLPVWTDRGRSLRALRRLTAGGITDGGFNEGRDPAARGRGPRPLVFMHPPFTAPSLLRL